MIQVKGRKGLLTAGTGESSKILPSGLPSVSGDHGRGIGLRPLLITNPGGPEDDQTGFAHGGWVFPYFDES